MIINATIMQERAAAVSSLVKLLASESRLLLLCQLVDGERSVGDLAERTGLRGPAVSQHLALLRSHRVVRQRRDGQTIFYSIGREDILELMQTLYQLYCQEKTPDDYL